MSPYPLETTVEILLVEDNDGDVRLTQEALRERKMLTRLHRVRDGVEAMEFLRGQGRFAGAPRPDLILLDLNLPRKDGREVLEEVKSDVSFRTIPVVVLTSSPAEADVLRAYDLHANCYVVKPVNFDRLIDVIQTIEEFWLTVARLPPHG